MKLLDIKPKAAYTLVKIVKTELTESGIITGTRTIASKLQVSHYLGEVVMDGTGELEPGTGVVFNELAGYPVITDDDTIYAKVVAKSNLIVKTTKILDMQEDNTLPLGTRVLVKLHTEGIMKDGIIDDNGINPREMATQKGTVISVGPEATSTNVGDKVAFEPFCGSLITDELKTVHEHDLLFTF